MADAPITFTHVNNLKIAEAVAGDGQSLLMLHGWGAHIALVWPLAERMISQGYRVYIPDLPGFGQSAEPLRAWTIFDYAEFIVDYMKAHQLHKVFYFGHSFGGRLGLILGAEHPDRIIKMALADSAGVRPKTPLTTQIRLTTYKAIRDGLYKVGAKGAADGLRNWYSNRYGSTDYKNVSGIMRETFVNVVNADLLPYAARVQPSTLLFWGDKDNDTPLWQGKLLEKTIPDAGLIIHEGAGHYSYLDRLADTARVMDYFFKQ